ncbi:hypothetical protein FAF44_38545 [Nonomuraea sp. MG754425]|uniref:hypothetical protein n=1 Tax=Nonomuraea sp. MG754425 TaxID=2570319 RepID=UPI001F35B0F0|nr:hypothetical protein [Nonomuraea sp. MG754425]MCF6474239.1 hypothetical protein [Nonomuraea sp. MG754425]
MGASRADLTQDDLRLKVAVQRGRLGGADFRVIRPARPLQNGALYEGQYSYEMYADRVDGRRIGTLMLLAARSPRSLIYLPMRTTPTAPGVGWYDEKPLDLVLAHRAVQFRPSRWKRLREHINAVRAPRELRTASVPVRDLRVDHGLKPSLRSDPNHGSLLHQAVHAQTLFLTGDTTALREAALEIFAVTKDGPPHAATKHYIPGACNYHVCRSLYDWSDLEEHGWEQFHVEFCPRWAR